MPYIEDKTIVLTIVYSCLCLLLTPFASYLLAIFAQAAQNNTGLTMNSGFHDVIGAVVSASLFFPLWLSNKYIKTLRKPTLNPKLLPYIILLGVVLYFEYMGCYYYFILHNPQNIFSISYFFEAMISSLKARWLFTFPFAVILLNLILNARFSVLFGQLNSAWSSLDNLDELGYFLKFVAGLYCDSYISAVKSHVVNFWFINIARI